MKKILSLIIATVLLQSCATVNQETSTTESEPIAEIPKICETITKEEVSSILDSEDFTQNPVLEISEGADGCKYIDMATSPKTITDKQKAKTFNVIVRSTLSAEQSKNEYDRAIGVWQNSNMDNWEYSKILNVGTEAFWAFNETTPQLITYQENTLLIITLGNLKISKEEYLEKAKTIASLLFERL